MASVTAEAQEVGHGENRSFALKRHLDLSTGKNLSLVRAGYRH